MKTIYYRIAILFISLVLIYFLYLLAPVLQPFYLSALIAYLCNPVVDRLQKFRIPRVFGVLVVFILILSVLTLLGLFLIPLIVDQINSLIHKLPILINWLQTTVIPWLNTKFGDVIQINLHQWNMAALVTGFKTHQDMIGKVVTTITSSGVTLISLLFQLILIPVVTFYLLRDWNKLISNCRHILPRHLEPTIVMLVKKYNQVLRAFIRGQLLVMIILSTLYTTGLWMIGLQYALLIGVAAGFLNIVPYLGFSVGLLSALLAAYYQFSDFSYLIYVLLVFLIGQSIESMLLTPWLVGDSIGLHPVAVIFAVLTGGYFFGLLGALIALPIAAAIMVLMRYGLAKYYQSPLYYL